MRFIAYTEDGNIGIAAAASDEAYRGLMQGQPDYPGSLEHLVLGAYDLQEAGRLLLQRGAPVDLAHVSLLPPIHRPEKIICAGINYADHSAESGFDVPVYPAIFLRVPTSLIGAGAAIIRPCLSDQLDYEGELVAVIGRGGRHIPKASALDHVLGYSVFNEASVRDFQLKPAQWTVGKNFDGTGAFGPALVTADELPPGASGLAIQTRLNGQVVQDSTTAMLIFDVATLVSTLSEAMTLSPGDLIVTGTPSGVGLARKPPLWMKPGDVCEVEIEGVGLLRNPVVDEPGARASMPRFS